MAQAEAELPETAANDVAFHMTDWLQEFEGLYQLFQNPESFSPKEVSFSDIFGVGAVDSPPPAGSYGY